MAENISNLVNFTRAKGRPKGSLNKRRAHEAAAKAEAMIAQAAMQASAIRAPSFGANEPDEPCFLKHVQAIRAKQVEIDEQKRKLKVLRGQNKDLRNLAKSEGVVLGELDRALKDADTEDVDLGAREARYHLYMSWLGKPISFQAELPLEPRNSPELEAKHWRKIGEQAGRLGKPRDAYPDCMAPEQRPNFLAGWDDGQEALMRKSPLTASAFDIIDVPDEEASEHEPANTMLTLREVHFVAGTEIEDANRSTIFDDQTLEAFDAAENVIVIFGKAKRIIKEPGYLDDGGSDTPLSEVEEMPDDEMDLA